MKDENKTINITFRVSPLFKIWLDLLVEESDAHNVSSYLNFLILNQMKKLITEKASEEGRDCAAKQFGLSDNVRLAIKTPNDIKGLFGNTDNVTKFLDCWAREAIQATQRLFRELDFGQIEPSETLLEKLPNVIMGDNKNFIEQLIERVVKTGKKQNKREDKNA